jgi:alpha-galactosidase
LVVRCVAVAYDDFPVVEWTLFFRNAGRKDTPVLSDVLALDTAIERFPWPSESWSEFVLHHNVGSPCEPRDYQPLRTILEPGKTKRISALGGRPSNSDLPYFNLELPTSEGVIVAVGWPGQWAARFARDNGHTLRLLAGQERTHFRLRPGEEVRSPLIAVLWWKGTPVRAQNLWRRWMMAHNLPRPGGRLPPVQLAACSSHQFGEMINADTSGQKLFIDRYLEEGLKLDYWWMDAGWYWNKTGWPNTGTWEVDTKRFPGGLRPISDHAHRKGVKTIVWFEPERVTAGTWLTENHPEWILGGKGGGLLDLGNDAARRWLTDHVDQLLTGQAIDLYRQDFNMDPLDHWRSADAPDRVGITEIKHVAGYLAYWDELRRRHPDMLIDSCASGGRRNDLETLRRAVPLLRSDYIMEPVGNQAHTYGIASWMPYHGTGTGSGAVSPYLLRSVMCPHFTACFDVRRRDLDYAMLRRILAQWRRFAPYYFGDFYPLTPYSLDPTAWIGWQFDCPENGEGMIQAFRRHESIYETARLHLQSLDPAATYRLTDLDTEKAWTASGKMLLDAGLAVTIGTRPGDVVIVYQKMAPVPGPTASN